MGTPVSGNSLEAQQLRGFCYTFKVLKLKFYNVLHVSEVWRRQMLRCLFYCLYLICIVILKYR